MVHVLTFTLGTQGNTQQVIHHHRHGNEGCLCLPIPVYMLQQGYCLRAGCTWTHKHTYTNRPSDHDIGLGSEEQDPSYCLRALHVDTQIHTDRPSDHDIPGSDGSTVRTMLQLQELPAQYHPMYNTLALEVHTRTYLSWTSLNRATCRQASLGRRVHP